MIGLQEVCIDNNDFHERLKKSNKIEVGYVPCLLIVYPNGGIEKYEASHAFKWFEDVLNRLSPPPPSVQPPTRQQPQQPQYPPQQPPQPQYPPQQPQQYPQQPQYEEPPSPDSVYDPTRTELPSRPPEPRRRSRKRRDRQEKPSYERLPQPADRPTDPPNRDPVSVTEVMSQYYGDRHRNVQQPPRIRQGEYGEYIEDTGLFSGEPPPAQRPPASAIRDHRATRANDPNDIMAKADALKRGREMIEQSVKPIGAPNMPGDGMHTAMPGMSRRSRV